MKVGLDKNNIPLQIGDICKYTFNDKEYEGMINYDEEYFAFVFEMVSDGFTTLFMNRADYLSIEKIISVWSTNINDKKYEKYRNIISK